MSAMTSWNACDDVISLEEAWAMFPLAMRRANLGIGHLMTRPEFRLRLWDDSRTLLAQAATSPREREAHVTRSLLRNRARPLMIDGVTHLMARQLQGKWARSACDKKVDKRQDWEGSRDRAVDRLACVADSHQGRMRDDFTGHDKTREELEALTWTASVRWRPVPGIWSRYGASFSTHPRRWDPEQGE